jgi:hypothetical protein
MPESAATNAASYTTPWDTISRVAKEARPQPYNSLCDTLSRPLIPERFVPSGKGLGLLDLKHV